MRYYITNIRPGQTMDFMYADLVELETGNTDTTASLVDIHSVVRQRNLTVVNIDHLAEVYRTLRKNLGIPADGKIWRNGPEVTSN
jgi:hypothetical protein